MYCPGCAIEVTENLKFCKRCGSNLTGVRDAMERAQSGVLDEGSNFDWNKTWVAEMLLRPEERDRMRGITPEVKRYNEIKAGVITACIGVGVCIFLNIFMAGIASAKPEKAEILSRIWVAGIIPLMVGLALIINGTFVSKRMNKTLGDTTDRVPTNPLSDAPGTRMRVSEERPALSEARFPVQPDFSVAEPSTKRMPDSNPD